MKKNSKNKVDISEGALLSATVGEPYWPVHGRRQTVESQSEGEARMNITKDDDPQYTGSMGIGDGTLRIGTTADKKDSRLGPESEFIKAMRGNKLEIPKTYRSGPNPETQLYIRSDVDFFARERYLLWKWRLTSAVLFVMVVALSIRLWVLAG